MIPNTDPVNLYAALVIATLGGVLFLWIVIRLVVEHRRKRQLLAEAPDWSAYDDDLQRYLRRVWLLIMTWRERVDEESRARLDELVQESSDLAGELQRARRETEDSSDLVTELVDLEQRIEATITAGR